MKIGLLARIRSARDIPSLRGSPPTRITQSAPSNASSALSDALTSASSGNAQSSSSIMVPFKDGSAGVISSNCKRHGLIGPEDCSRGDPKQEGITDLAPGSRNGNANWRAHAGNSIEEDSSSRHLILVEGADKVNHLVQKSPRGRRPCHRRSGQLADFKGGQQRLEQVLCLPSAACSMSCLACLRSRLCERATANANARPMLGRTTTSSGTDHGDLGCSGTFAVTATWTA